MPLCPNICDCNYRVKRENGENAMKLNLTDVLELHADKRMDIGTVDGEQKTANRWTIGDKLIQGHPEARDAGGHSFYIVINKIVSIKVY
jgi:hypothetical protein